MYYYSPRSPPGEPLAAGRGPRAGGSAREQRMSGVVVIGAQWGDEGKGKIVDLFTERADLVVRFAGGPNAGHTLVVGGEKVVVRLTPSGILRPQAQCMMAQGMVIDPWVLLTEIDMLEARGISTAGRLFL